MPIPWGEARPGDSWNKLPKHAAVLLSWLLWNRFIWLCLFKERLTITHFGQTLATTCQYIWWEKDGSENLPYWWGGGNTHILAIAKSKAEASCYQDKWKITAYYTVLHGSQKVQTVYYKLNITLTAGKGSQSTHIGVQQNSVNLLRFPMAQVIVCNTKADKRVDWLERADCNPAISRKIWS